MAKIPNMQIDPTLEAMDKQLEFEQSLESPRNYLGASQIGDPCWRKLFYSFRNAAKREISASGIKAIQDGFCQEDVTIKRLRALPFINLYNDDGEGNQIGFNLLLGHMRGHVDGVISGLIQAPKTPHVFEHKSVNETKFKKLKKIIEENGEKEALQEWDEIYFAQAQIYCHALELTRHYTVVSTPGGRDHVSCRTNYNKKIAEDIITKAKVIIFDNWDIPSRMSEKREFYLCKWCEFSGICHDGDFPLVHCKTCRYSEPVQDGKRKCLYKNIILDDALLHVDNCPHHIYNPALVPANFIEHQEDCCLYETESGVKFSNCIASGLPELKGELDAIHPSIDLYQKIKNVNNFSKDSIAVQKAFNGEMTTEPAKAWDKANKADERLKGI